LNPAWSLTAHNASSTQLTLTIMLVVVVIFVPIVLAYQAWAYNLFKTKVTAEDMIY
jgi:cytochrome bd ubiquinol oxidase subunit II